MLSFVIELIRFFACSFQVTLTFQIKRILQLHIQRDPRDSTDPPFHSKF